MLVVAGGSVPDHGFGLLLILLSEDDIAAYLGMFARLPQPFFHTATPDFVCGGRWCGCSGSCRHTGPPESGGLTTVCGACVPRYATSTLPHSDIFVYDKLYTKLVD